MSLSGLRQRWQDLRQACLTLPSGQAWLKCGFLYGVFVGVAIPLGLTFNFLHVEQASDSWLILGALLLILFVAPSLLEELFFRGLLLPHPQADIPFSHWVRYALISLIGFILWHPLNGLTFSPAVWPIFSQPVFLVLATLFGIVVTWAYWISASLWPSVIMHWLTITGWILFFGGRGVVRGTLGI